MGLKVGGAHELEGLAFLIMLLISFPYSVV